MFLADDAAGWKEDGVGIAGAPRPRSAMKSIGPYRILCQQNGHKQKVRHTEVLIGAGVDEVSFPKTMLYISP
jgi:hypothetical protein